MEYMYGEGTHEPVGNEISDDLPSTVVKDSPHPMSEAYAQVLSGVDRIKFRFDEALDFIHETAEEQNCRCSYMRDPNCIACKARALLKSYEQIQEVD